MSSNIREFRELRVYGTAMDAAMEIFRLTANLPDVEKYSLVDQIRRSSRSVCTNIAEGWRKRRYRAAFIAKISDAESEAAETQVWLEFSGKCGYLNNEIAFNMVDIYDQVISGLIKMIRNADDWLIRSKE
jgi:four helix bundle protein